MAREERTALLTELIRAVAKAEEPKLHGLLEHAAKRLKDFKGTRVSQFAVQDRLQGLIERAEISNGEELGKALRLRVNSADNFRDKLMPEYLALLLELSDNPIEKTDIRDLDLIKETITNQQLSWDDILRDDPLDNADGLWDNVNFAGDGSSDEDELSLISAPTDNSVDVTSLSLHRDVLDPVDRYETIPVPHDLEALETLRSEWDEIERGTETSHTISELQIIREILFMLRGHDTNLFERHGDKLTTRPTVKGEHLSQNLLKKILDQFSSLGERLSTLRRYANLKVDIHVLQSYQYCLSQELHNFDLALSTLEKRCTNLSERRPTLLEVLSEVRNSSKKLLPLGEFVHVKDEGAEADIKILEYLFDLSCSQQGVGNMDAFALTADVFDKCFHTYLQSINDWIFRAEISSHGVSSFIEEYLEANEQKRQQLSQFRVAHNVAGKPKTPTFLRPFVPVIFNTGKSLKFLQLLRKEPPNIKATGFQRNQSFYMSNSTELTPFSEQFRVSFEQWLEPIHTRVTSTLSYTLRMECGLQRTITALHDVFLGQYGPSLDYIADGILSNYMKYPQKLTDAASLTAIYHEAFVIADGVTEDYISIRIAKSATQLRSPSSIGSLLAQQDVSYRIPWTIASIVSPTTLTSYQRIHTTLLHLRVAKRAIDKKLNQGVIKYGASHNRVGVQAVRLSHRLRWFAHTLQSYFLDVAIRDAVPAFLEKMDDPGDLDHKTAVYMAFIQTIERRFLLHESASTAHQAITSILDLIVKAAGYLQRQWAIIPSTTSRDQEEASNNSLLEDSTPSLADLEEDLERLKGFEVTYAKFLGFLYTSAYETARLEGDKCMQMLVESLTLGTSTRISMV